MPFAPSRILSRFEGTRRMAEAVYILCMGTSLVCAALLLIGYRRRRTRLLFWSCLCFVGLAINNLLLFLDLVVFPDVDLGPARDWAAFLAMGLLVFGLVWDTD